MSRLTPESLVSNQEDGVGMYRKGEGGGRSRSGERHSDYYFGYDSFF